MRLYDQLTTRRRHVLVERLKRLPIWGHPALRVRFRAEGFDGYVFGCRAGPSLDFSHLAHDLAHAVQFGPDAFEDRLLNTGRFRFACRQVRIAGQSYDEPATGQCTQREAETFAIQLHLMELTGRKTHLPAFKQHVASTLEFLPDWYHFPRETRLKTVGKLLDQHYAAWTKERICDDLLAWLDLQAQRMRKRSAGQYIGEADVFFAGSAQGSRPLPKPRAESLALVA